MNGDGAENLQALGVADSGTGGHGSGTSDTASEQQLVLLQLQFKIAEAETEKQRLILESQRLRARNGAESDESDDSVALGGRSEEDRRLKFASLLKGVLAPMLNQEALAPMWFEDVEATLESYEVPSEWLSAAEYKRLFAGSKKGERESWDQFAVRLKNYFDYCVQSSKVGTFEELKQLVVADCLKECLSPEGRAHVICNQQESFLLPSGVVMLQRFEESEKCKAAQKKANVEEW
ncbi:hypothetical protein HPB51_016123 [Rhipicephalus microplus]|uniref:Uncharacterized protein n=1 Tax=Rhipicephalus microplus TaxID=6941 RepID=A0A9J6DW02_RHIMP|nr:hypothetical protein HPB51_016123 [Rhipicephalus microplus]